MQASWPGRPKAIILALSQSLAARFDAGMGGKKLTLQGHALFKRAAVAAESKKQAAQVPIVAVAVFKPSRCGWKWSELA